MATNFYKLNGSYYKTSGQKIANPAELQTYAKTGGKEVSAPVVPAGATKISGPSGLVGLTEKQITRVGKDIYRLPETVSTDNLGKTSTIPTPEPTVSSAAPFIASLDTTNKGFESLINTINAPLPSEEKVTPITKRVSELTGKFEQKPVDYQTELDKYGFGQNVSDLQTVSTQLAAAKAQYDKLAEENKNLPISSRIIGGTADRLQRQSAVELGSLSSMAQALQGNITLAQGIADKTINIKYEPIEKEIADQKWQLDQVYNQLTREEKRKADALTASLNERLRLVEAEKSKEKDINTIMTAAAKNGADSATLQNIMKASDINQAVVNAGGFLKEAAKGNLQDLGSGNFYNPNTGTIQTINEIQQAQNLEAGIVTTSTGDAYDIKSYATDPTHEQKIQSILNRIGKFNTIQDIDNYIKSKYPNSPVTGQMVAEAAGKYGVSWEMIVAIMEQDSSIGTAGKAVRTKNPGNVGNTDSGATQSFASWQEGVDAVAKNLAWRKTTVAPTITAATTAGNEALKVILGSGTFTKPQQEAVTNAINNGEDPLTVVKNQAKNIMGQTNATQLQNYETAKQQIQSIKDLLAEYYRNGGSTNIFSGTFEKTLNKLGAIKDPKLVNIATNISAALQVYRNSVSGTAFSVQEGKEIASIFPGIDKTQGLNEAVIAGRLNAFDTTIDASYRNVLGNAYDQLKGVEQQSESPEALYLKEQGLISEQPTQQISEPTQSSSVWNSIRSWFGLSPTKSSVEDIQEKVTKLTNR